MSTPRIYVEFDADEGNFALMCESHSRTAPAGPRLFRAPPHPRISFRHETIHDAEHDARALREYLNALSGKFPSRSSARKMGA